MNKYDFLIIGSGLGGLITGAILSKEGYEVCIVEKNYQIGGVIQNFVRDGVIFDTGGHYVGGLDEGQNLHRYFSYLGLIKGLKIQKMDVNHYDIVSFLDNGMDYPHAMGFDNFVDQLARYFPQEREHLKKYIHHIKETSHQFPLFNLESNSYNIFESGLLSQCLEPYLREITHSQRLQNILAGNNLLYAGEKDKTPFYVHALIQYSYLDSSYRFIGGTGQLAHMLAEKIKSHGGHIFTQTDITSIEIEDKQIAHATSHNGTAFKAHYYISNVHPTETFRKIDKNKLPKIYYKRLLNLANTISVFSLYLVLKKNTFKYLNHNYYIYRSNDVWNASDYSLKEWPDSCMFFTQPSTNGKYAQGITILAYMRYDELKKWQDTDTGNRGADYEAFKKQKAEELLDFVETRFPDIRACIKNYYTSTPLTYRDYTATEKGALYGVSRDCNDPYRNMVFHKSKIPNLFFFFLNTNLHGIMGVTIGSILTCSEFLGLDYLIGQIKKA